MRLFRQFLKSLRPKKMLQSLLLHFGNRYNLFLARGNIDSAHHFLNPVTAANGSWFHSLDLVRTETLEFISREISEQKIEGIDKYKGVKEAVRTFAKEVGVSYCLLPDVEAVLLLENLLAPKFSKRRN